MTIEGAVLHAGANVAETHILLRDWPESLLILCTQHSTPFLSGRVASTSIYELSVRDLFGMARVTLLEAVVDT